MPGLAPWLQPANPAKNYIEAYQTSAQISEANQRLQMQAAQAEKSRQDEQQRLQIEQQQFQQKQLMDQQKSEILNQYHQSQIGLANQKLEEASKVNQLKIQQAADKSAAMMEASARIKNGEDPSSVWMELGPRTGNMGGMGSLIRAQQATAPKDLEIRDEGGQQFYRSSPTERYQHIPPSTPQDKFLDQGEAGSARTHIKALQDKIDLLDPNDSIRKTLEDSQDQEKRNLNAIYQNAGRKPLYPDVKEGVFPIPSGKDIKEIGSKLVVGKVYKTKKGSGRWNGRVFISVQEQ